MPKEKKSAADLEAMILDRALQAGMRLQSVTVSPSKVYGWEANYFASTTLVLRYADLFDGIVHELLASFDLEAGG